MHEYYIFSDIVAEALQIFFDHYHTGLLWVYLYNV